MQPKALVFDMDGTLLDTLEDIANAANRALVQQGYAEHPVDSYRHFVGSGARELVRRILPEGDRTTSNIDTCLTAFKTWYDEHWNVQTRLYEGIDKLLDYAVSKQFKIAILTNKPQTFALQCQQAFLSNWPIDLVQGHEEGLPLKPDAAISQRVTDALQLKPEEIWYFGDSDIDMYTAKNAGYHSIGVTWGFRSEQELLNSGAQQLVHQPEAIIELLVARKPVFQTGTV